MDSNEMDQQTNDLGDDFQYIPTQQHVESTSTTSEVFYIPEEWDNHKPNIGQEFDSLEAVYQFYNEYAKRAGFSIRTGGSHRKENEIIRKEYVCFKEGSRKENDVDNKRRRGLTRENCKAKVAVVKSGEKYKISVFVEQHSHPLTTPSKVHLLRSHRSVSTAKRSIAGVLETANVPIHQQMSIFELTSGGLDQVGCTEIDLRNAKRDFRKSMEGHDAELLKEHFDTEQQRNPSFFYAIETDSENRLTQCFWADATSRRAYSFFGDVLVFDTTYNTNRYSMIFAPFIGVNNHGQSTFFGCGLLSNESTESFIWLFDKWMEAMPNGPPKMIITDQDPAMSVAIAEVFPNALHRFCIWHILNKFSEKLGPRVWANHYNKFSNCIWDSDSTQEFESKWMEVIEHSGMQDNEWLKRMFALRSKWVPAFVKDVFAAGMSSSQRAESNHAFFKRFVNKNNSFIDFISRLNRALGRQRHGELMCDHKDKNEHPTLKTKFVMEKQMVDFYTCEIFLKFQDEILECMWYSSMLKEDNGNGVVVYRVQNANESGDKVWEIVDDSLEDMVHCSCKMFEWEGIPCRHLLHYLIFKKCMTTLPEKYILKRWGKTAKSSRVVDGSGVELKDTIDKSLLVKHNQLCQLFGRVVDRALLNPEKTHKLEMFLTSFDAELVSSSMNSNEVAVSTKSNTPQGPKLIEPNKCRPKGCGKRLKGGKERAKEQGRKCAVCGHVGKVGDSHDKRNCPMLKNIAFQTQNEDAPHDRAFNDGSSPKGVDELDENSC